MLRTFFAIPIPATAELRQAVQSLAGLGRTTRAVNPETLHITLKFLGDTSEEQVPAIAGAADAVAARCSRFTPRLVGLGVFPSERRPSVVWAGIHDAEPLCRLATELDAAMRPLGFSPEGRPFQPHLTLARIRTKPPKELAGLLRDHAATNFGTAEITAVELLRSELLPAGPHYTVLHTSALA